MPWRSQIQDSWKSQCGSREHETNHSGPLGMFICVCMHDHVCGCDCVYISVYLCLLSPSIQASKYACVYVRGVCALKRLGTSSYIPHIV